MTADTVKVLGTLLANYYSDLTYIDSFQTHKKNNRYDKLQAAYYVSLGEGSFKQFLNDFRVARNVHKEKTAQLLEHTMIWVATKKADDVDEFAEYMMMKGLTHSKIATSLASKILFLNNPWVILPSDRLAKQAINTRKKDYANYLPLVGLFKKEHNSEIMRSLKTVEKHLEIIEAKFPNLRDIKTIRLNRYVDKMLWTMGKV